MLKSLLGLGLIQSNMTQITLKGRVLKFLQIKGQTPCQVEMIFKYKDVVYNIQKIFFKIIQLISTK